MSTTCLLTALATLALVACSIAQPIKSDGALSQPVDLGLRWQIMPRTPIPHVPFDMVDPSTGLPVKSTDIIIVDGQKWVAGEYYTLLNTVEAELNKYGYSLADEEDIILVSPEIEAELAESARRREELSQQPLAGEPWSPTDQFFPASCRETGRSFDTGTLGVSWLGLRAFGAGHVAACYQNNELQVQARGNAVLDARLAGSNHRLFDGNVSISGAANTQNRVRYQIRGSVSLFGSTAWTIAREGSQNGPWSRSFDATLARVNRSYDVNWGRFDFLGLATVRLLGRGGVEGQVNLRAEFEFSLARQRAAVIPNGNLTGYAELLSVKFDIGVADLRFWVEGRVTFFDGSLKAAARGLFYPNTRQLHATVGLFPEVTALSGRVDACVRVRILGARKSWRNKLFDWDGLRWSGTLGRYDVTWQL